MLAATASTRKGHPAQEDSVVGERLADLGAWELYRFAPKSTDEVVCVVALLPADAEVAYGVYRASDAEPSASGAIARNGRMWSNGTREAVLREILHAYRPELPALAMGIDLELDVDPAHYAASAAEEED
jgi:hypothetical protein